MIITGTNNFFIDSTETVNKTGLFFIGVGCALLAPSNETETVEYRVGNSPAKYFQRKLPISYSLRVLTKACYYIDQHLKAPSSHQVKVS